MKRVRTLPWGEIKEHPLLRLMGTLGLAGVAVLFLLATFRHAATAEVNQTVGYVNGRPGGDVSGCGITSALACETIQFAVDEGYDVIYVNGGTFTGSLDLDHDLLLKGGWSDDFAVWDPASYETIVVGEPIVGVYAVSIATGTTVLLDGLTIAGGDDGVHVYAHARARLTHVHVRDSDDEGIESNGDWLVVSDTVVLNTKGKGILVESGNAIVYSSTIRGAGDQGIFVRSGGRGAITHTLVVSTGDDGIRFLDAASGSIVNNRVLSPAEDGIDIDGVVDVLVQDNTVSDASKDGLNFEANGTATFRGNVVSHVGDDAIVFKGRSGVIENNRASGAGDVGVAISNALSISVMHNILEDTLDEAVLIENSETALVSNNAISRTGNANAIYVGLGVAATIEHNRVYSVGLDGINFQGTIGQIQYNQVQRTGGQGINVNADDTTVLGNTVYDTQRESLRVRGGSMALVRENTFYNVLGAGQDAIRVEPNVTATIVANVIYGATDDGITFNGTVGTISENQISANGGSGIDVDAEFVTVSANQIFDNGHAGIELEQADQFAVSNNLVGENVAGGVLLMGRLDSAGTVVNNTLVGHPTDQRGIGVHVATPSTTLALANNIIIRHATGISVAAGAEVELAHNDVWHNLQDYAGVSSGTSSIQKDPLLADVGARDYHLRFGSPCVDAGMMALAPPSDFEGEVRAGNPDIGADELIGLSIAKMAPAFAERGESIPYTIVITNYLDFAVTDLVVTDVIPAGAHVVGVPNGTAQTIQLGQVWWRVDRIGPHGAAARLGFVVTATATITNDRYRVVTSTQGVSTGNGQPVVTVVGWRNFLPVVLNLD